MVFILAGVSVFKRARAGTWEAIIDYTNSCPVSLAYFCAQTIFLFFFFFSVWPNKDYRKFTETLFHDIVTEQTKTVFSVQDVSKKYWDWDDNIFLNYE